MRDKIKVGMIADDIELLIKLLNDKSINDIKIELESIVEKLKEKEDKE